MKYAVIRITTNAEGGVVVSPHKNIFNELTPAEAEYHTELADCCAKVIAGRQADGCLLITNEGTVMRQEFHIAGA